MIVTEDGEDALEAGHGGLVASTLILCDRDGFILRLGPFRMRATGFCLQASENCFNLGQINPDQQTNN